MTNRNRFYVKFHIIIEDTCGVLQLDEIWLKTQTVIAGRLAKMLGAVAAEVRERREVHQVGYLGE